MNQILLALPPEPSSIQAVCVSLAVTLRIEVLGTKHRLSISRARRAAGLSREAYYKVPPHPMEQDAELIDALNACRR